MPVSICDCIYMEDFTCSQISEKVLKRHVATYKIFGWLKASLKPSSPQQMMGQDLGAKSQLSKTSHVDGLRPELGWHFSWSYSYHMKVSSENKTLMGKLLHLSFCPSCQILEMTQTSRNFLGPVLFVTNLFLQKWSKAILVNFWYYLHPRSAQATRRRSAKWHIL